MGADPAAPIRQVRRDHGLDGLRGVAALIVVVHHVLLASSPALAAQYGGPLRPAPPAGSWDWWLTRTPLHIVWAGQESVWLFFVLSGYVLTLPAVHRGNDWFDASYYPRRIARLAVPVWGALIVAALLHAVVSRASVPGATWWLDAHSVDMTVDAAVRTATIVLPTGLDQYASVLWSLQWEMLFSLLLPVVIAGVVATRHRPSVAATGAGLCLMLIMLASVAGGSQTAAALRFMPLFVLGSLLAMHRSRLELRSAGGVLSAGMALLAATLLTGSYLTENRGSTTAGPVGVLLVSVGALFAVWLAVQPGSVRAVLAARPVGWLGTRSFSLYLVHEPIVVTLAFALGGRPAPLTLLVVAMAISLVAAEAFYRLVEQPSVIVARQAGDLTRSRLLAR